MELTDVIKTVPFAAAVVLWTVQDVQPVCVQPPIARTAKNPSTTRLIRLNAQPSIKPFPVPEQPALIPVPSTTTSAVIIAPTNKALPVNKVFAAPMNAQPVSRSIMSHRVLMDVPIPTRSRNASEPVRLTPAGKMGLFAAKIAPSLAQAALATPDAFNILFTFLL